MLIAPLDWGLGHATRCIPVVEKLLSAGFKVIIAAEGDQKILLQKAFPALEMLHLPGYKLKYSSTKRKTLLKIFFQIPKILMAINRENSWLRELIKHKHLDIIIADNRFGLHHPKLISIFVTHQLHIKTSLGKIADACVQKINYRHINQFNQCWIPDYENKNNLAGDLSHPFAKPRIPLHYIGLQSAIKKSAVPVINKLLILLSGPEPQRTILENILLAQLKMFHQNALLVRGLPASTDNIRSTGSLRIHNYLTGTELAEAINQSDIVICRSGYSTMMDLIPLQKKCIVIPTPGQPEQEYLAAYLSGKKYVCAVAQHRFSLDKMMQQAEQMPRSAFMGDCDTLLQDAISQLLLQNKR